MKATNYCIRFGHSLWSATSCHCKRLSSSSGLHSRLFMHLCEISTKRLETCNKIHARIFLFFKFRLFIKNIDPSNGLTIFMPGKKSDKF